MLKNAPELAKSILADINTPNDDKCFGITPYPISIILKGSVLLSSSFT